MLVLILFMAYIAGMVVVYMLMRKHADSVYQAIMWPVVLILIILLSPILAIDCYRNKKRERDNSAQSCVKTNSAACSSLQMVAHGSTEKTSASIHRRRTDGPTARRRPKARRNDVRVATGGFRLK
jgi:hypothetical protein